MDFASAVEALYCLKTGAVGTGPVRHERPHKPVLLLAIFDAVAAGIARPDRVEWTNWLRNRFSVYFQKVKSFDDDCSPELPFFHLKGDGFWQPRVLGQNGETALEAPPKVRDADTGLVFARFIEDWRALVAAPTSRAGLRDAIISRYFPKARTTLDAAVVGSEHRETSALAVSEDLADDELAGRSAGFRRRIVELYDYQCVACGLRIWIPDHGLSFVDAAHLIPFSQTRSDHPTNGLALCKNHHWALDQRLIAPGPDKIWRVSRFADPRRSRGEEELCRLGGQPLLTPTEPAFAPDPLGLEWRLSRLLN